MRLEARKVGHPSVVKIEFCLHDAAVSAKAILMLALGLKVIMRH